MPTKEVKFYSDLEESLNVGSHVIGAVFSVVALVLLIVKALTIGTAAAMVAMLVYGLSLIALYLASSFYHASKNPVTRTRMRVVDHAAIYVLIAGTYTPFMLITMPGFLGYTILIAAWSMAVAGVTLKLFFTGRFEVISTLLYVFMGWAIIFAIKPLAMSLSAEGLFWLFAGGIAYTVGAVLYAIKQIPLNHAIFHVFVLMGSAFHFVSIYFYS